MKRNEVNELREQEDHTDDFYTSSVNNLLQSSTHRLRIQYSRPSQAPSAAHCFAQPQTRDETSTFKPEGFPCFHTCKT